MIKDINVRGGRSMPFALLRARVIYGVPQRRAREARQENAFARRKAARP